MKVFLLTDMPPCTNFTAGIVLLHLSRFLIGDNHTITCHSIVDPSLSPEIPDDIKEKVCVNRSKKPREGWGNHGPIFSLIFNNLIALVTLPKMAKSIRKEIKEFQPDFIWCVVQGQTMINVSRLVVNRLKIPYVVQVWDPPQWWLNDNKFDLFTYKAVMNNFGKLLRESRACLAASWSMATEYYKLYGANCIPVMPSLESIAIKSASIKNKDTFVIALAGQIYAKDEWNSLIDALEELNWQYDGKKIQVNLYGSYFFLNFKKSANILIRGWLDQKEVLKELSQVDLLYCPYWFSKQFEIISRLSFPAKLTSYLSTGVPVLVHAPDYASTSIFIKRNQAGYVCNSGDKDVLRQCIIEIICDENRQEVGSKGYAAFVNNLTFKHMKHNFYVALGIEKE